jgi:TatD DNase family protein
MPVCIHSRDADGDTLQILKEEVFLKRITDPDDPEGAKNGTAKTIRASDRTKVLMHCFSGSAELARQYVKLGAKISLGGPVTYKNARHSVKVAEALDIGDLLIETDSPYMAPVPMRGKQNKPTYVQYVANKIAEIKGITYKEAADATYRNACSFYRIAAEPRI